MFADDADSLWPRIVAHRGGAAEAPENTLAAFRRAASLGIHGVECDVHLTADGVVVVHHDPTLCLRPGGMRRAIDVTEASEVLAADLGWTLGCEAQGQTPPTLDSVLDAVPDQEVMIELKQGPRPEELGTAVGAAVTSCPDRVLFASYDARALAAAHGACPEVRLLGIARTGSPTTALSVLPLYGWALERQLVDAHRVRELGARGEALWSWTVTEVDQVEKLVSLGVHALITDIPSAVRDQTP